MVNQAVSQAVAEVQSGSKAQNATLQGDNSADVAVDDDNSVQTSTLSAELKSKAYEKGYQMGTICSINDLDYYTEDNEKNLKYFYLQECRPRELGKENHNNRELYNEYRRGFLEGFENGNNSL